MGFYYRKSIEGNSVIPVKDYPLDSTYVATAKRGDIVKLSAGKLVPAVTGDTAVLGVMEGCNFEGLGVAKAVGKVRLSPEAVYQADYVGAGALTIGTAYGIDSSHNLDTADTSTLIAKIVEVVNGKPYVVITARQLV